MLGIKRFKSERGATAVEYSLLVAILCVGLLSALANMRQNMFTGVEGDLEIAFRHPTAWGQQTNNGVDNPHWGGGTQNGHP